ncbi:MAG TPA: sigma-70 family RNA polymerase sigma factor [Acidobacteriaceae bacterium]|jgi:RNA polymerase sigma-70 factor (ECF subfamily)|nr:sigma-70 family RNA polymerase sigma factor [Acidobacteriaceae bacterium]
MTSDGAAYFPETLAGQSDVAVPEPCLPSVDRPESRELSSLAKQHGHQSDETLLAEVGHGAKEALSILFRRYRRAVLSVAQRILTDPSEAEDLCQEVFLYLFQKAKLFDASKGTAASWIIQITYHRAINRRHYLTFRQHYNAEPLDEEQIEAKRQPLLIDGIVARTLLNRIREQLSPDQRQTLELHFFEGYSLREIAEKTSQTLGNIRHHYYRGLACLRSNVFPQKDA